MSNLLSKASIILTPTAYAENTLFPVKPPKTIGDNSIVNGDFATDSNWTKGDGWSISGGVASSDGSQSGFSLLSQTIDGTFNNLQDYEVTYTITSYTSGSVCIIGFTGGGSDAYGTNRTEAGTYTEIIRANGNSAVSIRVNPGGKNPAFVGSIDNVIVKKISKADFTTQTRSNKTRVNESGNVETVDAALPRIDYTGGVGHILFEPQSTNLFLNSATLSTQSVTTSAASHTISFYGTGSITLSGTHSATINGTGANNRVSLSFTPSGGTLTCTVSGSVTNAQIEALSYATSYIPTTSGTVTRTSSSSAISGGLLEFINSSEGVLYVEAAALANDGTTRNIALTDNSLSNRVCLEWDETSNVIKAFVVDGGSHQTSMSYTAPDLTQYNKIALKYKANDMALWFNGSEVATDTSGTMPSGMFVFETNRGDQFEFNGKIKCLAVYKEALTDAELTCLTT